MGLMAIGWQAGAADYQPMVSRPQSDFRIHKNYVENGLSMQFCRIVICVLTCEVHSLCFSFQFGVF